MVASLAVEIGAGVAAIIFLYMFYTAVRVEWPHSYYSISDFVQYRLSISPTRYALVRFAPVMLATFFVAAVLNRAGRRPELAVGTIVLGHYALTSGRAVTRLITGTGDRFARKAQFVGHLVVGLFVTMAGLVGLGLSRVSQLTDWIPSGEEIAGDMLFALFAAVGGAYLVSVSRRRRGENADEMFHHSIDGLDPRLIQIASDVSRQSKADTRLVMAILVVENLQRPPWVRLLERVKGRFISEGTYGVMQVRAPNVVSDEESIRKAVPSHFSNVTIDTDRYGEPNRLELQRAVRRYNGNRKFVEMVERLYRQLGYDERMRERLHLN